MKARRKPRRVVKRNELSGPRNSSLELCKMNPKKCFLAFFDFVDSIDLKVEMLLLVMPKGRGSSEEEPFILVRLAICQTINATER